MVPGDEQQTAGMSRPCIDLLISTGLWPIVHEHPVSLPTEQRHIDALQELQLPLANLFSSVEGNKFRPPSLSAAKPSGETHSQESAGA